MRHQRFLDVSQSADLDTFERRLVAFANDLGFGLVGGALVVDRAGRDPEWFSIGNTPAEYVETSKDPAIGKRDPLLKRLKHMSVPVIYDQLLYVDNDAADIWERQAAYGYRSGIAVALHLPGHKHFLLGFDRDSDLPKEDEALTGMLATLQFLAVHAQDAALRLLPPKSPNAVAPTVTRRELEVLRWTMEGKTAYEIGCILNISENGVNFHVRNILAKFGTPSKHHAVLRAIALGLI